jgi:hypothetical protein
MNMLTIQDEPRPREYPNAYAALPISVPGVLCPHTGLRHAHLSKLLKPGGLAATHVRVVALREPGARHGKTLFHVGDMLRWLDKLAAANMHASLEVTKVSQAQASTQRA